MQQEDNRWCIYIDILGFSKFWECDERKALKSLRALMRGISAIGSKSYPESPNRLFAHQTGDGFAIVSDFGEPSLDRPIAVALMRHVATTGTFAAAAIAEGDFADITGCYPPDIFLEINGKREVDMGMGLMILSSVMGTAFIRAYRVGSEAPSGPFLTIAEAQNDRIPDSVRRKEVLGRKGKPLRSVDWIRNDSKHLNHIRRTAEIDIPSPSELRSVIEKYCENYPSMRDKWGDNLRSLLDIEVQDVGRANCHELRPTH